MTYTLAFDFMSKEHMICFFNSIFDEHDKPVGLFASDVLDREREPSNLYVARHLPTRRFTKPIAQTGSD